VNPKLLYLDSSAILKIVVSEPESKALVEFLGDWPNRISSELARTEVLRALRRANVTATQFRRGQKTLERISMVPVDTRVLNDAALLKPTALRSLDAIHLATVIALRQEVGGVITYDGRLSAAATASRLAVWAPGSQL
jgi:predicted nucleic acid-binding protein